MNEKGLIEWVAEGVGVHEDGHNISAVLCSAWKDP